MGDILVEKEDMKPRLDFKSANYVCRNGKKVYLDGKEMEGATGGRVKYDREGKAVWKSEELEGQLGDWDLMEREKEKERY